MLLQTFSLRRDAQSQSPLDVWICAALINIWVGVPWNSWQQRSLLNVKQILEGVKWCLWDPWDGRSVWSLCETRSRWQRPLLSRVGGGWGGGAETYHPSYMRSTREQRAFKRPPGWVLLTGEGNQTDCQEKEPNKTLTERRDLSSLVLLEIDNNWTYRVIFSYASSSTLYPCQWLSD